MRTPRRSKPTTPKRGQIFDPIPASDESSKDELDFKVVGDIKPTPAALTKIVRLLRADLARERRSMRGSERRTVQYNPARSYTAALAKWQRIQSRSRER